MQQWMTDMRMPKDSDVRETFSYIVRSIRDTHPNLAFIDCPEPRVSGNVDRERLDGESNEFLFDIWVNGGCSQRNRCARKLRC